MNTEKIEKLKKALSNSKIPADLKPKIEAEIKRLEDLDSKSSTPKEEKKEEEKPVVKKASARKPAEKKSVASKSTSKKESETKKPKRTPMSLAKEIRKEGESWKDARARASKMMKEGTKEVKKTVESELDKLSKLVKSQKARKKLAGLSGTNIQRDSLRKAKPKGRRISKNGKVYYENRDNRTDRLAPNYPKRAPLLAGGGGVNPTLKKGDNVVVIGKRWFDRINGNTYHTATVFVNGELLGKSKMTYGYDEAYLQTAKEILLEHYNLPIGMKETSPLWQLREYDVTLTKTVSDGLKRELNEGGYLTDPTFGNFQNQVFSGGGKIKFKHSNLMIVGSGMDRNGNRVVKVSFPNQRPFSIQTNGNLPKTHNLLKGYNKNTEFSIKEIESMEDEIIDYVENYGSETQKASLIVYGSWLDKNNYAKGGGVTFKNGREYSLGRNWTNDHRHINKSEDHEVNYKRKRFELGGNIVTDLAGHTGGSLGGDPTMLDGFSNTGYTGLVGETGAMSSGEMFENGGGLPTGAEQPYMITESFGNPAQHYANGGGIGHYKVKDNVFIDYMDAVNYCDKNNLSYDEIVKTKNYANGGGFDDDENKYYYKNIYNSMTFKTEEELKKIIKMSKPFIRKQLREGNFVVVYDGNEYFIAEKIKLNEYARGGGVTFKNGREYSLGRNWTNDHRHINKAEDHEVNYKRKKFMAGGMNTETPKIYVADLKAYNNGRLVGEWLDLSDYDDADELMDAIQGLLDKWGVEEYAIHDVEYIPSSIYSEYMGKEDFEELYEMMELADRNDLPLEVVMEIVSQYDRSAVDEFQGKYESADDFAYQLSEEMGGIQNFIDFERYLYVSDTDRRLLSQEMADGYVDDIRDEDGGNRLIEEAGMNVDEYEEADSERQEEMLDEAREIVYDEYYDNWYEGLSDPYNFLVEEQGMYDAESFANASFVQVDYEALGDALEDDYTYIYYNSDLYVFNVR